MKKILAGFLLLTFVSCNNHTARPVIKQENDGDAVYNVGNDDEEMNKAIERANLSYDSFISNFKNPGKNCSGYTIKMRFAYPSGNEHMWVGNLFYKDDKLMGILDSDPVDVPMLHAGDTIRVIRNDISDWMYICDHKMVGGYTMLALYNRMTSQEKEEFKKNLGFQIE
jgi:uncharacterized protein YegJ (DUF2314 family)